LTFKPNLHLRAKNSLGKTVAIMETQTVVFRTPEVTNEWTDLEWLLLK